MFKNKVSACAPIYIKLNIYNILIRLGRNREKVIDKKTSQYYCCE